MSTAPYAVPSAGLLGRTVAEPEDPTRNPFQRDRDRIIHTQAFRRLQGKTQVFVAGEGDHYRTRLTHTMEVAQIGRDVARTLGLNEDLAECIALAHDLGHPPFGHRGEEALDAWMEGHGLSFEHNDQSVRIVTLLEQHSPLAAGLNMNREVVEGMQKHREALPRTRRSLRFTPSAIEGLASVRGGLSLEAQVVNCADEIAYSGHDCDDGLRAGLFSMEDIASLPLVRRANGQRKARGTELRGAIIHLLVSDLYAETARRLQAAGIRTVRDVYDSAEPLVSFSRAMEEDLGGLRSFLWERMYNHPRVSEAGAEGQGILRWLCDRFFGDPTEKVLELKRLTGSTLPEAVKDYVAGMTDSYARTLLPKL
ncbi:MAG: dGTP triphosphohydrolase [Patescibacteria group bacterium]